MNQEYNNSNNEKGTLSFSEQIVNALFHPSEYKSMLSLKTSRHVGFVFVMMLVLGIVTFAVPTGAIIASFGGFEKLFYDNFQSISYTEDDGLSLDKVFQMNVGGYRILVDTSEESVPDSRLDRDGVYMVIGSKMARTVMSLDGSLLEYQKLALSNVFMPGFNIDTMIRLIPGIYIYLVMFLLFTAVGCFAKYGLFSLVFSIVISSLNRQMHWNLSYGQVFMLCFYSQTLGYIISNFNSALGLLPTTLVSIITIFITIHMLSKAVVSMNPGNEL